MKNVAVVIGPGSIGQAIARRVSAGKHVVLADLREENANAAAKVLSEAGFEVSTTTVDVSSRESVRQLIAVATAQGAITGVIHAAGVSPSQASPDTILKVDLYSKCLSLGNIWGHLIRGSIGQPSGLSCPWTFAAVLWPTALRNGRRCRLMADGRY